MTETIITWKNGKTPHSTLYDDIYFSTEDGLAESRAVFLDGIGAPAIFLDKSHFTICELGFGTGLNFFATVNTWLSVTTKNQKLSYIATEKHPLSIKDIKRAVNFAELDEIIEEFPENYKNKAFDLFDNRVQLRVLAGDSREQLSRAKFKADCWYLDGFSPAKNPDMWCDALCAEISNHSVEGSRLATFTAASKVRRSLAEVGFKMSKRSGFGKKREMSMGVYSPEALCTAEEC